MHLSCNKCKTAFASRNNKTPCLVDPARRLSHYANAKYYVFSIVVMHHLSLVRSNLSAKFENSSYHNGKFKGQNNSNIEDPVFVVPDYFNIGDKWKK